jgi:tetratricopeptide (TPR) repeat protein
LLVVILAGCATQPADDAGKAASQTDKDSASQLYSGAPAIVHGTEFPVTSAAEGIQRGDQAYREGKLDLATFLYVESLKFDATAAEPFLKIGAIHEQRGNRPLAEKAFELALERQPDNAIACEHLGLLYLQSGRTDEGRALLERTVAIDPNRWRAYSGLGIAADRRQDYAAAIASYDRALAIEPRAAAVMNNRGYSRFLAGDLAGAEADLKEAIRLGAGEGSWTNLGKVQAAQARYAEALASLLHDMKVHEAYNLLGEAAMRRGDYMAAQRYFQLAIRESPTYFEAAQKNLVVLNERMASEDAAMAIAPAARGEPSLRVVLEDTKVYFDGKVVGLARRGERVVVLESKQGRSRVRVRDAAAGADVTGWVPSAVLADRP